ncbi:MAG: perosamine synthetase [Planctomycetaceae bacterium]|jgi:perosamine synthetase
MWVRKRIDIGWLDLLSACFNCVLPGSRSATIDLTEAAWSADGRAFACLSVRSGLDLLLQALELPSGSEVLVSALTIPDMVRIIEHHGLVAVPIDLHDEDVSPRLELLGKLVTDKTRAILVAQLFGSRFDLTPFVEFATQHDLVLIEDCAQAFEGDRYKGHDEANVSMFSFGPIKTATALGGGVFRIKDETLLARMRELQAAYPVQTRWFFLKRVLFYSLLKFLGGKLAFGLFVRTCRLLGKDFDQVLNGSIRNFPEDRFFASLRQQPSFPLLRLMVRRIRQYRNEDLDRRATRGALLASLLPLEDSPGAAADPHSFWIFPLRVPDAEGVVAALREAGFDSTVDNSLQPVKATDGRSDADPKTARRLLNSAIFLPVYEGMPEYEIRRMAQILRPLLSSNERPLSQPEEASQ